MKVPIVECPKCGAKLKIIISDEDLIRLIAKRLGIEFK